MPLDIALLIGAIVLLIAMSAFFNMSETGLTAASRARIHALEQEGDAKAALVNRLLSTPEKLIGAVLIGNTLVDVLAAGLASALAIRLVGEVGVIYATAVVTMLIVIFAAVLPKTYALAYSVRDLRLTISDDGRGFDDAAVQQDPQRGIGLRNMRERMNALAGTLTFHSTAQGTTLQAWLPLPPAGAPLANPPA